MKFIKNTVKVIVIASIILISAFSITFISVRAPGLTSFNADFNLVKALVIGFLSLFSLLFNVRTFNFLIQKNDPDILDIIDETNIEYKKIHLVTWLGNLLFSFSIIYLGSEMLSRFTSFSFDEARDEDYILLTYAYYMILLGVGLILNELRLYLKVRKAM